MSRGFTLIEVAIALTIFAMSIAVLLEAQVSSLHNADKARGLTVASILARAKMVDIERKLFDEGFTLNEVNEDGDFTEEGHADYKWKYRLSEVELDLSALSSLCSGFGDDKGDKEAAGAGCEDMLSGLGGPIESLLDQISKSLRLAELTVTWPDGKFHESMTVRALLTREDLGVQAVDPFNPGKAPPP
ncbi:MAG: prepilin-type N-terminal cleavage/methylation domain-containing protein [Deltaproteobacteria bacterium]|nr:prepilin-type N-terminal cleavage/methylation domain-containing protein [Deltaproteobacteria bacterium]